MTNPDREELVKLADELIEVIPRYHDDESVLEAAVATLRRLASSDGGVKVKPLVWRDHRPDSFPEPAWSAQTSFGFYNIEEVSASDSPAYVVRLHAHHFVADKDSLDDAKAAAQADYEARIRSALIEVPAVKGEPVAWPANLNPRTLDLVQRFALALAKKLRLAEEKYGHTDGWLRDDWEAECRDHLYQHLEKGDPRDVAAYCAFMWHHGWITYRAAKPAPPADAGMREALEDCRTHRRAWHGALEAARDHSPDEADESYWRHEIGAFNRTFEALTAPGATTKSDGGEVITAEQMDAIENAAIAGQPLTDPLAGKVPCHCHDAVSQRLCLDKDRCYTVEAQSSQSDPSSTRSGRWVCAARQRGITLDPQDCDWPVCGCDPLANKVLDTIAESGFVIVPKDGAPMTDDQIKHMVDRFLGWTLPENFNPDGGVSFKRLENRHHHPDASPFYPMPVGTNLFDAVQATAMVRHMLDGLPSSTRSEVTVEELATAIYNAAPAHLWMPVAREIARALLDQFEIRRKK